jgi:hypothetical protein
MKLEPAIAKAMLLPICPPNLDAAPMGPIIDVMVKYGFLEKPLAPAEMIWHPSR